MNRHRDEDHYSERPFDEREGRRSDTDPNYTGTPGWNAGEAEWRGRDQRQPYGRENRDDWDALRHLGQGQNTREHSAPEWRTPDRAGQYSGSITQSMAGQRGVEGREERRGVWTEGRGNFAGRGPRNFRRSDDSIREDVCDCLTRHPDIDASEMEVQVSGGQVTLTGSVEDRHQKRLAEDAAETVPGVVEVHNLLRVGRGILQRVGEALGLSGDKKSEYL